MILLVEQVLGVSLGMDIDVFVKKIGQERQSDRYLIDLDGTVIVSGNDSADDQFVFVFDVGIIEFFFHVVFDREDTFDDRLIRTVTDDGEVGFAFDQIR